MKVAMTVIQRDRLVEIGVFAMLGGISGAAIALLRVEGFKAEQIFALAGGRRDMGRGQK
jgi:hypothetical protein